MKDENGQPAPNVTVGAIDQQVPNSVILLSATTDIRGVATRAGVRRTELLFMASGNVAGCQQHCGGPVTCTAQTSQPITIKIEYPIGNCFADLNPNSSGPRSSATGEQKAHTYDKRCYRQLTQRIMFEICRRDSH